MDTKEYILDLLSRGSSPAAAAQLAGVSQSYVAQLQKEPLFAEKLALALQKNIDERDTRNKKIQNLHDEYLDLEGKTLAQLKNSLWNMRPGEKVRLLQVLASKKEPPASIQPLLDNAPKQVVSISIPTAIAAQFVMNTKKEIVGLEDGVTFSALPSKELAKQAAEDLEMQQQIPLPPPVKSSDLLDMFTQQKKLVPVTSLNEDEVQI